MEVTRVQFFPTPNSKNMLAFVSLTFDNVMILKGWRLLEGKNGIWCSPPSKKSAKDNKWYDDVLFVDGEKKESAGAKFRQTIQDIIREKWAKAKDSPSKPEPPVRDFDQTKSEESPPRHQSDGLPF